MVTIKCIQPINAGAEEVFDTLLEHAHLGRFFGGKCKVIQPASDINNINGAGLVREVFMRGTKFLEEILVAKDGYIEYRILGDQPLKNHLGVIDIQAKGDNCIVNYTITFDTWWWQPNFIVKHMVQKDISSGLIKLAGYLGGRNFNSIGN